MLRLSLFSRSRALRATAAHAPAHTAGRGHGHGKDAHGHDDHGHGHHDDTARFADFHDHFGHGTEAAKASAAEHESIRPVHHDGHDDHDDHGHGHHDDANDHGPHPKYGHWGTLGGASPMVVYGKQYDAGVVQLVQDIIDRNPDVHFAQSRSKLFTSLGPISYWSGHPEAASFHHTRSPLYNLPYYISAGPEFFHLHRRARELLFKIVLFWVVGVTLFTWEWWHIGQWPKRRIAIAAHEQTLIWPHFIRNEMMAGFVPQLRWIQENGEPEPEAEAEGEAE